MAMLALMLLLPLWFDATRPYVARAAVRTATVEAGAILIARPLLSDTYTADLESFRKRGLTLLSRPGVEQFRAMSADRILKILDFTGSFFAPLMSLLLLYWARSIWQSDMKLRYRTIPKLQDLMAALVEERPFLRPVLEANLLKANKFKGPWRIKHSFISFAIEYGLLLDATGARIKTPPEYRAPFFDEARAKKVFENQLGPRWTGDWTTLKPHQQAVYGLMAGLVCRARKDVIDANNAIAGSFRMQGVPKYEDKRLRAKIKRVFTKTVTGGAPKVEIDFAPGIALAKKYGNNPEVVKMAKKHAYFHTVIPVMKNFGTSQRSGEFSGAHYQWLRPIDRTLFCVMHQVGLEGANMETAGPFAHLMSEQKFGIPSEKPLVAQAVLKLKSELINETWLEPRARNWDGSGPKPPALKVEDTPTLPTR